MPNAVNIEQPQRQVRFFGLPTPREHTEAGIVRFPYVICGGSASRLPRRGKFYDPFRHVKQGQSNHAKPFYHQSQQKRNAEDCPPHNAREIGLSLDLNTFTL